MRVYVFSNLKPSELCLFSLSIHMSHTVNDSDTLHDLAGKRVPELAEGGKCVCAG